MGCAEKYTLPTLLKATLQKIVTAVCFASSPWCSTCNALSAPNAANTAEEAMGRTESAADLHVARKPHAWNQGFVQ